MPTEISIIIQYVFHIHKLLDCWLIGVCVVIKLNTVFRYSSYLELCALLLFLLFLIRTILILIRSLNVYFGKLENLSANAYEKLEMCVCKTL